jgi:uncharacterized YccA/Bax inhibitor family protein
VANQMLNDRTFSAEHVANVTRGRTATATMTYGGVVVRSLALLAVTVVFAALGWKYTADWFSPTSGLLFFVGYIVLVALTLAAAGNPRIAPVAGFVYAVLMGGWVGAISRTYEHFYDGIVGQAVFTSLAVFLACLLLYGLRIVKVTNKFASTVIGALVGLMMLYFFGWIFRLFGIRFAFLSKPTALGIGIAVLIAILAALTLLLDFAAIEGGVKGGAPKAMEWYCAYGLLSTLVWMYLEILRVLVLVRARTQ